MLWLRTQSNKPFSKIKPLANIPIQEKVHVAAAKGLTDRLSPTGINNYLRWLLTFLNWCRKRKMVKELPIEYGDLRVADPVPRELKRLSFNDRQLTEIFTSRVYQSDARETALFWVPLIALWNGMRMNEICQLDTDNIQEIDGIWGYDITKLSVSGSDDKRVKTEGSIRVVPIHPRLIDFGLLDFHSSRNKKPKLFGDITIGHDGYYSSTFSKVANRYLKEVRVHGPKHKFHSLRHTFRDALRRGRVDREIGKALGGWKRGRTDAFDIYGDGFSLDELEAEIQRVDYPNVDWSELNFRQVQ